MAMFFLNDAKVTKLEEQAKYHFEILKALFVPAKNIIQIVFILNDETNGYSEIILQEFDISGSEFYELIHGMIYPTEFGQIIEVNTEDFKELSGWCQIVICGDKPKIMIKSIEPELSGVSAMQAYYGDI